MPAGDGQPLWILTITLLFARKDADAEVMVGEGDQWSRTSVSICAVQQRSGRPPIAQLLPKPVNGIVSWPRILPAARSRAAPPSLLSQSAPDAEDFNFAVLLTGRDCPGNFTFLSHSRPL